MQRRKIGLTIEECVGRAERFIEMNGRCYLAMDVIGSSRMDTDLFYEKIAQVEKEINENFMQYFLGDVHWGRSAGMKGYFEICRGDKLGTYVNSAEAVEELINFYEKNYSDFPARWAVGKEGQSWAISQL